MDYQIQKLRYFRFELFAFHFSSSKSKRNLRSSIVKVNKNTTPRQVNNKQKRERHGRWIIEVKELFTLFCGMDSSLQRCSNSIPWILQAPRAQCLQTHHPHHTHQAHHHHEKLTIQRLQPAMERPMAQPGTPFGTRASQMPESRPFQSGWSVQKAQSGQMYNCRTALFPIPQFSVKNLKLKLRWMALNILQRPS